MRYRVTSRRAQSIAGVVLTLVVGNLLLVSYTLRILNKESEDRVADLRQNQEDEIIAEVRGRVETTCLMIRHIAEIYGDTEQAQLSAMEAVSSIRFGENNYLWVHRLEPDSPKSAFMLVHPADELRGRDNAGLIDLDRITHIYHEGEILPKTDPRIGYVKPVDLFAEFNRIALSKGEGIVSYFWPKIVNGKASPEGYRKVAFIKYLPEWHWVVGAGAYADYVDLLMKEHALQFKKDQAALAWRVASGMMGFSLVIVLGYVVVEAMSAEECLEHARGLQNLDVLLTDLVMPGLNGKQVSELVKEIRPETRVLYMSGYTADIVAHHGLSEETIHFIPKPFDIAKLGQKLREVLAG